MKLRIAFVILFVVSLGVWTWKLLESNPLPPAVKDLLNWSEWLMFVLAKSLHAGAYAYCTVIGRLGFTDRRVKFGIVVLLILHGIGTEIGQTYIPYRYGSVRDAVIDAAGVLAGWAFAVRVLKA